MPSGSRILAWTWRVVLLLSCATAAYAGGPRWVAGPPFFTAKAGTPIPFYTADVRYFTDPGVLSTAVSHAQADAMVAAAAAVWNVEFSRLTLAQGGALSEHVSTANTYMNNGALMLPPDVAASNYRSKPIAVIYDTDGGLIDMLLGSGASAPTSCRNNAVVESVDDLNPDGTIHHALLLLNGRCATSTGDPLTQMQYQLARAFGRVLGLAWSQLNDNVFTGSPAPSAVEMAHWPLMHPIDVNCGPYTFKCMQDPFRLREDDIATLVMLYPVTSATLIAGKTISLKDATEEWGRLLFPTGQGMEMVNISVRRGQTFVPKDAYNLVSAVAGGISRQYFGNPVTGPALTAAQSMGTTYDMQTGWFVSGWMPIISIYGWNTFDLIAEPINPLYTGDHAIAPYLGDPSTMSGSKIVLEQGLTRTGGIVYRDIPAAADAASLCNPGNDGTERAPAAAPASGYWNGQFCGDAHSSWFNLTVKPAHTFTIEVAALDESGAASALKAHPVIGAWLASDPTGTLPSVAAQAASFNTLANGVTALPITAASTTRTLRVALADARGMGRPDFTYTARFFYADTVAPTQLPAAGGTITISGTGFHLGNKVLINGVAATVISWTANTIVATAPSMTAAGLTSASTAADVEVLDATSGSSTTIQAALTYNGVDSYAVAAATPQRFLAAASAATWTASIAAKKNAAFAPGVPVTWTASTGLTLATASTTTDSTGTAAVTVSTSGLAAGATGTVTGCAWNTICTTLTVSAIAPSQWKPAIVSGAGQSIPATQTLAPVTLAVTDTAGHPLQSAAITVYQTVDAWAPTCPVTGRCPATPVIASSARTLTTDADGLITLSPLELPATAGITNIAATTGSQGFLSLSLVKTP